MELMERQTTCNQQRQVDKVVSKASLELINIYLNLTANSTPPPFYPPPFVNDVYD